MTDAERRDAAITRLKAKHEFFSHLLAYIVVNAFLIMIWSFSTQPGHFWPMWSLGGWGIGLAFHAYETFRPPLSEAAIQRQMEKM